MMNTDIAVAPPAPPVAGAFGPDGDTADRWLAWQARGATTDRHTARWMSAGFVTLFVITSAWLMFQLLR